MVAADEDALVCDFAEVYHIYDWRALPATYAATLAKGLSPESRIKRALSGEKLSLEQLLLAIIADSTKALVWHNTEDGHTGRNPPASVLETLLGLNEPKPESSGIGFDSPEEFKAWRASMIGGGADG